MAFQAERERILAGGVILRQPADKVPAGHSRFLQNFRVDQMGQLVSRQGSVKRNGPIGSGTFHSLTRFNNDTYAGIGTKVYHGPEMQEVDSGYDGKPLGIAHYLGGTWIMNRARQSRMNGAGRSRWGVEPPQSAPVATGGGQLSTLIDEFDGGNISVALSTQAEDGSFTSYAMQNGSPVESPTAEAAFETPAISGSACHVRINTAATVSIYSEAGGSMLVGGEANDDDVIRVWVYCSNPRAVESLSVFVKSGNNGHVEYAFNNPQSFLNQSLNSWTQLKIRRRVNLDEWTQRIGQATKEGVQQTITDLESQLSTALQTPTFLYVGSGWPQSGVGGTPPSTYPPSEQMLNIDWTATTSFGVSVKVTEACEVAVDKAEVIGTVGADSSGAIQYYVSFVNIFGEDSNPSPVSNSVIAGNQTITLNGIPVSSDPSVIIRYIYRIGGGLNHPLRVGQIPDNTTTGPWEDHTTNRVAQRDNRVMPTDRDVPPPARGVLGPVYGRMLVYNTDLHPARYWWTPAGRPWGFYSPLDEDIGDWEDAGSDSEGILVATDHRPVTVLYKERSIWKIVGDPATSTPSKTASRVSAFSAKAVVNAGGVDYFVGPEGVFMFNMDFETKLSKDIDGIFKGDYVVIGNGHVLPPLSLDGADEVCISVIGDRLKVSYPSHPFINPNVVIEYHIETGRWYFHEYTNLAATAFSVMYNEGRGPGRGFIAGATGEDGGYLYHLETAGFYFDDNQSARGIWQSATTDQGLPDNIKVYADVVIDFASRQGSSPNTVLEVSAIFDNGTVVSLGSVSSQSAAQPRESIVLKIPPKVAGDHGYPAKNFAIRVECDIWGVVIIYGVSIYWYPEVRGARTFDTGLTHLGLAERVKQIDHVELVSTGSGQQLERDIFSDLPGSLLIKRVDGEITAPNGRGNTRERLSSIVEGRNFRFVVAQGNTAAPFQAHQFRVRMRPIGAYIDGTIGEYWESPEFSLEPGRVAELGDFLLDYDVSGEGGRLELWSDLPGNTMTIRRTLAIPVRDRAPYLFSLYDPTLTAPSDSTALMPFGQLFKLRLYPPPNGILRLHGRAQFSARLIGVYVDPAEMWQTQVLNLLGGESIFREICAVCETEGAMTVEMLTNRPLNFGGMQVAARMTVNGSRQPFHQRLPGNTKGHLQQFRFVGGSVARLYELKVYARRTESPDTDWTWVSIPVRPTGDEWASIKMPMHETPADFVWVDLPVDPIG